MSEEDARHVPASEGRSEVQEKGSRFLGCTARAGSTAEAEQILERLRREHHDATHVAFAWKIGEDVTLAARFSDDGEPSGTAGKPIARAIEASGLRDVLAAVVRYFGGTRLGTGGLSRAYALAAQRALAATRTETLYEAARLEVRCSFDRLGAVHRLVRPPEICLVAERFTPDPVFELEVRKSRLPKLLAALDDQRLEYTVS